jgi:hypothetical protein
MAPASRQCGTVRDHRNSSRLIEDQVTQDSVEKITAFLRVQITSEWYYASKYETDVENSAVSFLLSSLGYIESTYFFFFGMIRFFSPLDYKQSKYLERREHVFSSFSKITLSMIFIMVRFIRQWKKGYPKIMSTPVPTSRYLAFEKAVDNFWRLVIAEQWILFLVCRDHARDYNYIIFV